MKIGVLKSIAHNMADSLACGLGFVIGYYRTRIFEEASAAYPGHITVDFLSGETAGCIPSESLKGAIELYVAEFPTFCEKHKVRAENFAEFKVRYGTDVVYGCHYTVELRDKKGRFVRETYIGLPGKKHPVFVPSKLSREA